MGAYDLRRFFGGLLFLAVLAILLRLRERGQGWNVDKVHTLRDWDRMPRLLWIYLAYMAAYALIAGAELAHETELRAWATIIGGVLAIGFTVMMLQRLWVWLRSPRPLRTPVTPERKQFRILIGMATWVTLALVAAGIASEGHFGTFLVASIVLCSPAALFGGIWLWWIRQKR